MNIFFDNSIWMTYNILLAFIAVINGNLFLQTKSKMKKCIYAFFWVFFLPNTIYMVTDMQHLFTQMYLVNDRIFLLILCQYILLLFVSITTFAIGMYPLDVLIKKHFNKKQKTKIVIILFFNFIVAFGVALGRFERINSWEIITNVEKVLYHSINLLASYEGIIFIILFGVLTNVMYFIFSLWALPLSKGFLQKYHLYKL